MMSRFRRLPFLGWFRDSWGKQTQQCWMPREFALRSFGLCRLMAVELLRALRSWQKNLPLVSQKQSPSSCSEHGSKAFGNIKLTIFVPTRNVTLYISQKARFSLIPSTSFSSLRKRTLKWDWNIAYTHAISRVVVPNDYTGLHSPRVHMSLHTIFSFLITRSLWSATKLSRPKPFSCISYWSYYTWCLVEDRVVNVTEEKNCFYYVSVSFKSLDEDI